MEAPPEYFTEHEWSVLLGADSPATLKKEVIISRAFKLSARCPSEKTIRRMTAIFLAVGVAPGGRASATGKAFAMAQMKADAQRLLGRNNHQIVNHADVHLEHLPAAPAQLLAAHPSLYHQAYDASAPPVNSKVTALQISEVEFGMGCRTGKVQLQRPVLASADTQESGAN